jgi:arylformamidase
MARIIDLGHGIHDGMPAYPGLPAARVTQILTHEASRERYRHCAEFALTKLDIAGNTGTYLDSPWHRHPGAGDIATIPLERVVELPGLVVDAAAGNGRSIHIGSVPPAVRGGALLIRTGWSDSWGTDSYWVDGPYLGAEAIDRILDAAPSIVGVDFANVDDPEDPHRPAHTRLLGAGILIVEHLTALASVPAGGFRFHCPPLAVTGAASLPVRPYAIAEEGDQAGR